MPRKRTDFGHPLDLSTASGSQSRRPQCVNPSELKSVLATAFNKAPFKPTLVEDEIDDEITANEPNANSNEEEDRNWAEVFGMAYTPGPSTSASGAQKSTCELLAGSASSDLATNQPVSSSGTDRRRPKIVVFRVEIGSDEESESAPTPPPSSPQPAMVLEAENIGEEQDGFIDLSQAALSPDSSENDWTPTDTPEPTVSGERDVLPEHPASPEPEEVVSTTHLADSDAEAFNEASAEAHQMPNFAENMLSEPSANAPITGKEAVHECQDNSVCQPSTSGVSHYGETVLTTSTVDPAVSANINQQGSEAKEKRMRLANRTQRFNLPLPSESLKKKSKNRSEAAPVLIEDDIFGMAISSSEVVDKKRKLAGRPMTAVKSAAGKKAESTRKCVNLMDKSAPIQPSPNIMSSVKKKLSQQLDRLEPIGTVVKSSKAYTPMLKDPNRRMPVKSLRVRPTKKIKVASTPFEPLPPLSSDSDSDEPVETEEAKRKRAAILARFSRLFPTKHPPPSLVAEDLPFKFSPRKHWVDITSDGSGNFDNFVLHSTWKGATGHSNGESSRSGHIAEGSAQLSVEKTPVVSAHRMNYKDILKAKEQLKAATTRSLERPRSQPHRPQSCKLVANSAPLPPELPHRSETSMDEGSTVGELQEKSDKPDVNETKPQKSKRKRRRDTPRRRRKRGSSRASSVQHAAVDEDIQQSKETTAEPAPLNHSLELSDVSDAECDSFAADSTAEFYSIPSNCNTETTEETQSNLVETVGQTDATEPSQNLLNLANEETIGYGGDLTVGSTAVAENLNWSSDDISDAIGDGFVQQQTAQTCLFGAIEDISDGEDQAESEVAVDRLGIDNSVGLQEERSETPVRDEPISSLSEAEIEDDVGEVIDEIEEEEDGDIVDGPVEPQSSLLDISVAPVDQELIWEYEVEKEPQDPHPCEEEELQAGQLRTSGQIDGRDNYALDDISNDEDSNSECSDSSLNEVVESGNVWESPVVEKLSDQQAIRLRNCPRETARLRQLQWNWKRLRLRYASVYRRRVVENLIDQRKTDGLSGNRASDQRQIAQILRGLVDAVCQDTADSAVPIAISTVRRRSDAELHETLARLRSLDNFTVGSSSEKNNFAMVSSLNIATALVNSSVKEITLLNDILSAPPVSVKAKLTTTMSDISDISDFDGSDHHETLSVSDEEVESSEPTEFSNEEQFINGHSRTDQPQNNLVSTHYCTSVASDEITTTVNDWDVEQNDFVQRAESVDSIRCNATLGSEMTPSEIDYRRLLRATISEQGSNPSSPVNNECEEGEVSTTEIPNCSAVSETRNSSVVERDQIPADTDFIHDSVVICDSSDQPALNSSFEESFHGSYNNYPTPENLVIQSTSNSSNHSGLLRQSSGKSNENCLITTAGQPPLEIPSDSNDFAPVENSLPAVPTAQIVHKQLGHNTVSRVNTLDDDSFVQQLESGSFFPDLFRNEPTSLSSATDAPHDSFWSSGNALADPLNFVTEADLFGFNFPVAVDDLPAQLSFLGTEQFGHSAEQVQFGTNAPSLQPSCSPVTIEELAPLVNCEDNYFSHVYADTIQRQINASGIVDGQQSSTDDSHPMSSSNDILQLAVNMEINNSSVPKIPRFNIVKAVDQTSVVSKPTEFTPSFTGPYLEPTPADCITVGGRIYQAVDTPNYDAGPSKMLRNEEPNNYSNPSGIEHERMTMRSGRSMAMGQSLSRTSGKERLLNASNSKIPTRTCGGSRDRGNFESPPSLNSHSGIFSSNFSFSGGAGTSGYNQVAQEGVVAREPRYQRCWEPLALPPSSAVVTRDFEQEVDLEELFAVRPHLYHSFRYSTSSQVIGESSTGEVRSCGAEMLDLWRQRIIDEPEVYQSSRGRRRGGATRGIRGRPPLRNRGGGRSPYLATSHSAPRRSQVDEWLLENIKSIMRKNPGNLLNVTKAMTKRMGFGKGVGTGMAEGFEDTEDDDPDDSETETSGVQGAQPNSPESDVSTRTQDEVAIFLDEEAVDNNFLSQRHRVTQAKQSRTSASQDSSMSAMRQTGAERRLNQLLPKSRSFDDETPKVRRLQPTKQSVVDEDEQSGVMVSSTTSPRTYGSYGGFTTVTPAAPFTPAKRPRGRPRKYPLKTNLKPHMKNPSKLSNESQLDGPSPNNSFGFNVSDVNFQKQKALNEIHHVWVMSVELHVATRGDLRPDPEFDSILAVFYSVYADSSPDELITGVIMVTDMRGAGSQIPCALANDWVIAGFSKANCLPVTCETDLFEELIALIRRYDPDILVGFEIQMLSWGYLIERAAKLNVHLCSKISRVPDESKQSTFDAGDDWWSMVDLHVAGRIVLNIWRIMRHELALSSYSFELLTFHLLRIRTPWYTSKTLTDWFNNCHMRSKVLEYYRFRVEGNLQILLKNDLISRTSELAKLFGIQFYEVLSRGSQFRVESMMLRMTKVQGFAAASPSVSQRGSMAAPECFALTLEPESKFYTDPVLVLDFQSLYPSVIIAYNYCYSTCLGRVDQFGSQAVLGCLSYFLERNLVKRLKSDITISPAGVAFVKSNVRRGILPQMLDEILNTRLMVKKAIKKYKSDKGLVKVLDARQLGLKLIANVTYGYTSANFSGRMPCVEIADSIVHKGRETLERAIKLVNESKKWDARVVYGDTDSMFVVLQGRSKAEAFKIGDEIADAVTKENPKPVKLKFEKVYYPCVLQTKKRYVGYSYETVDQREPKFDAKGIETVRRDTCAAVSKILQKSLCCLFETKEVDSVRQYLCHQFQKICLGRVNLRDFIFAKEYRGKAFYKAGASVPALHIARRRVQRDRRAEPRIGERVPYVITYTSPNDTLLQGVREPQELLDDSALIVNAKYYINNQICAALNRFLSLLGADAKAWFAQMPKTWKRIDGDPFKRDQQRDKRQMTLSQFFQSNNCLVCRQLTSQIVCVDCRKNPQMSVVLLEDRTRRTERKCATVHKICQLCTSSDVEVACRSLDCPVLVKRVECDRDMDNLNNAKVAVLDLDDQF